MNVHTYILKSHACITVKLQIAISSLVIEIHASMHPFISIASTSQFVEETGYFLLPIPCHFHKTSKKGYVRVLAVATYKMRSLVQIKIHIRNAWAPKFHGVVSQLIHLIFVFYFVCSLVRAFVAFISLTYSNRTIRHFAHFPALVLFL